MKLRPATDLDQPFFFEIRNDPATVSFSWSKRRVEALEHAKWWTETHDLRYVAEGITGDVGTLRLTALDDHACEVHLAVAPEFRGMGYSTEMLREATQEARRLGFRRIVARVDAPNTPSLRAFLRTGYDVTSPGTLLLEREI